MDSLTDGYKSLSKNVNKTNVGYDAEHGEGVISELTEELSLKMDDEELLSLKKEWMEAWSPFEKALAVSQNDNEQYWLGKQYDGANAVEGHALVDNLIFESLETFLPIATRPKADPVVNGNGTEEGDALADKVRKMIQYWENDQSFNLKLKQVVRFWSLYKLGVMKLGWSNLQNDVTCVSIRPQKLILDPDATIDSAEYTGEYIGEYRKDTARNLIKRFPKKSTEIKKQCNDKLGTKMQYIEWWTNDYVFWSMGDEILAKAKNPHWNYESTKDQTNEFGSVEPQKVKGKNHFMFAKKPYVFLSIFSLGLRPYDDTNLIQQNIPLQDLINKRLRQIDKNADKTNGGLAVSGDSFTKEQASSVGKAVEKGGTIFVPNGDVNRAVVRLDGSPLPNFVYESLIDYRNELRNIFGVRGSTAQGTLQDKTVRGKMQIKGQDGDRIGGGVSVYLEQFAEAVYNYFVQMMYVYYDEPHIAEVIGEERTMEYVELKSADLISRMSVSVKDGSMIPKDPMSQREEVMNLWEMQAIDPISFFEKLDFPDPKKTAEQLFIWQSNPMMLFPEVAEQMQPETDPVAEAQAAKLESDTQIGQAKAQADMQIQSQKAQADMALIQQKAELEKARGTQQMDIDVIKAEQEMNQMKAKHQLELAKGAQAIQLAKQKALQTKKVDSKKKK